MTKGESDKVEINLRDPRNWQNSSASKALVNTLIYLMKTCGLMNLLEKRSQPQHTVSQGLSGGMEPEFCKRIKNLRSLFLLPWTAQQVRHGGFFLQGKNVRVYPLLLMSKQKWRKAQGTQAGWPWHPRAFFSFIGIIDHKQHQQRAWPTRIKAIREYSRSVMNLRRRGGAKEVGDLKNTC